MAWNLDCAEISSIEILQISILDEFLDESQEVNNLKLQILSHSLAFRKNCAIFLEKCPEYSQRPFPGAVVLLFDVNDKSSEFTFPNWANIEKWVLDASSYIPTEVLVDFQHSITLMQYYDYLLKKRNVLYFTSFLLFPESGDLQDNILYKVLPVVRDQKIRLRTHVQGNLSVLVDPPLDKLLNSQRNTFLLMPPFENPFLVGEMTSTTLKLIQINKESTIVNPRKVRLVKLTAPPLAMQKYFDYSPEMHDVQNKLAQQAAAQAASMGMASSTSFPFLAAKNRGLIDFKTTEHLTYTEEDILDFFSSTMTDNSKKKKKETVELEFPAPQIDNLLYEQEPDKYAQKMIKFGLGKYHFPPSKRHLTTLVIATFLSFFRFDFGQSMASPPPWIFPDFTGSNNYMPFLGMSSLSSLSSIHSSSSSGPITKPQLESKDEHGTLSIPYMPIEYKELEIPNVLVNDQGRLAAVPATTVIDDWKSKRYMPISGQKSGHFVVFCDKSRDLSRSALETFMRQFCHHYNECNFGTLSEYPKCDPYHFATTSGLIDCIDKFFKTENVSEFQTVPILSFIFGQPIYNPSFSPRSILTYVRTGIVASADEEEIKSLAFVVYSRIRSMQPAPYGMWNLTTRESASLFFGFRYTPTFVLPRDETTPIYVNIGIDPQTKLVAWMDSIGSVLQVQMIENLDILVSRMRDLKGLLDEPDVFFSITILSDSLSQNYYNKLTSYMSEFNVAIYSCIPLNDIQVKLPPNIHGDVISFSSPEQHIARRCMEPKEPQAPPLTSCYVLNQFLPGYQINCYKTISKSPEDSTYSFVSLMHKLSWLSVKPLCEKRTVAYPPHILALLRKNNANTDIVAPYEFLPMLEKI